MKTIKELNEKSWYRLLKVVFVSIFIIIFFVFNLSIYKDKYNSIDNYNTRLFCTMNGNISTLQEAKDKGLNIYLKDSFFNKKVLNYKSYFKDHYYDVKDIIKYCYKDKLNASHGEPENLQKLGEILNKYNMSGEDSNKLLEKASSYTLGLISNDYSEYLNNTKNLIFTEKINYLDFSYNIFDIKPSFTNNFYIKNFIFCNIIIFILFIFFRNTFYYIFLGKFRPKE